jgi:hypothetical protein
MTPQPKTVAVRLGDLEWLCGTAVRYSVGRMSYAPSATIEVVKRYWPALSLHERTGLRNQLAAEMGSQALTHGDIALATTWTDFLDWMGEQ